MFLFSILLLFSLKGYATQPGWYTGKAPIMSSEEARSILDPKTKEGIIILRDSSGPLQIEYTNDIKELARALKNDPKLIYEFVRNHIDYVPYFGALKGASLTLLERSGNDFDQATLMIALLRESGYTAQYVYGEMVIPNQGGQGNYDIAHWLGVNPSSAIINEVIGSGGIPGSASFSTTTMDRVWVKVNIGGTNYVFDPAFKPYNETVGIDLKAAMGYSKTGLLTAAGGTPGTDYIMGLSESGINTKLTEYTTNLIDFLRANNPNSKVEEIIGGREIIPEYIESYPTTTRYSSTVYETWDNVPEAYIHKVRIQHGAIDEDLYIPDIAGKKLAITYNQTAGAMAVSESGGKTRLSDNKIVAYPLEENAVQVSTIEKTGHLIKDKTQKSDIGILGGSWDFGRVYPEGYSQGNYVISNPNSSAIQVVVSLSSNPSGAFSIQSGVGTHTLNPNQQHTITVRFNGSGQTPGAKTGELHIEYWYGSNNYANDYTSLTGVVANEINLTGSYGFDFGQTYPNVLKEGTCKLKNSGTLNLGISSITLSGTDVSRFLILSGAGAGTLAPGQERDIQVRYLASVVGLHDDAFLLINCTYDQLSYTFNLPLKGETISLPNAKLWLDDVLISEGPSGNILTLSINHPYAHDSGSYADQTENYTLKPDPNTTYVIISDFGGSRDGLLLKNRQKVLETYRSNGLLNDSMEVMTETLNVMGQTWMEETTLNENMLLAAGKVLSIKHHRFGIVAQEAGYYIDVKHQFGSSISRVGDNTTEMSVSRAGSFLMSALEHGVLEQLQVNRPAASTVKLLHFANAQGYKIFKANSGNYNTSIRSQLTGYSDGINGDLSHFKNLVDSGSILILPEDGQLTDTGWEWSGKGYVDYNESGNTFYVGMIIGGDYHGGYGGYQATVSTDSIVNDYKAEVGLGANTNWTAKSKDPISMTTGAATFESADISLGGAAPLGLSFGRAYDSANNTQKGNMGYGWKHNYDIHLNTHSDGESGLGKRLPVDCAALIAVSVATIDLMTGTPEVKEWTVSSLAAKWAMDQLKDNAVSVHLMDKWLAFIKLPDGTYSSPPGMTIKLVKDGSLYRLEERFDEKVYFDSNNKISSWRDADGNALSFTYNGDKLASITDAFGRSLTLGYTGDLLTSITDSTGRSITYQYDANNDLTGYLDLENKLWSYGYTNHRLTTLTNPLSITTATNVYDTLGRVKSQTVPRKINGSIINKTYNFYFSGFRGVEEDPEGNQTIYHLDRDGKTIAEENALGHKSSREFDGQNHVVKTTDPRGNEAEFIYDGNHNLVKAVGPLSGIEYDSGYTYDANFQLTDTYLSQNDVIQRSLSHLDYDSEHHLEKTTIYPATGKQIEHSNTYYPNGLTNTTSDGKGIITTLTYDPFGNPDTSKVDTEPLVDYVYNSRGWMSDLNDQAGSHTGFTYNNMGQILTRTDPLSKVTGYTYYDDGSLHTITDRKNNIISYSYTPSGKMDTITYQDLSTINFQYDSRDNLYRMLDSIGTTTYNEYDAANRLRRFTDAQGFEISYNYDNAGNLTTLTYPGNKTVSYTYDELNRLETVSINFVTGTPGSTFYYDASGRLDQIDQFNGTKVYYGYDNADRLTDLDNEKGNTTPIATYHFTLDNNGNRTHIAKNEPLSFDPSAQTINYTYNTQKNRLLTAGTDTFTHDYEGQLSAKNSTSYAFDYEHRLKTIGSTIQYFYDGMGNRVKTVRSGVTTKYIYDARGNLLAEADANNVIQRYYIYGNGLMAMVTAGGQVYCYHFNATGSTIAITDSTQNIVNKYAYTPFGEIGSEVEAFAQPFKYVGQYGVMSESNGLYYMRARYYDPTLGRFLSEDPLGFGGGDVNLYVYVNNNPVMLIDPSGEWIVQAIGGGIGAIAGGYSAYKSGGDWKDIARSAAIGGVAGVLSTIPIPGINPLLGGAAMSGVASFLGNVSTQVATGTSFENVNYTSASLSALAGAVGGCVGGGLANSTAKQIISGPTLTSVRTNQVFTSFGKSVVNASVGGSVAGVADVGLHKLY